MAADRIRKAAKRNPEGCLTFRVLPTQRVGILKPIEASGDQHPTGRRKRPLGTGVNFAWWVPYFLAHCNFWIIFGAFWSHLEIPIDLRYFFQYYHMGRDSIAIQRIRTSLEFGIREL